ncbi:unnamed protein product [Lampetra fluviatilis]
MSRRKQTKPQQHFGESGEGGPDSSESGDDKSSPRAHVCDSCCGQFPTVAALGQHMESCGKAPAVFIVEESDKVPPDDGSPGNGIGVLREGFPVAVAVAVPNGDGKTKAPHFPNDSPPPLEGSKRFRADSSGSVGGHAVTSSSSGGGGGKGKVNGYSSSEALEVGRSEKAAAAGGNKVAMSGAAASLPFIVEQLVSLHQQQMNQLHLIEQIRSQVTLMVAASSAAAAAAAASIPMRLNHAAKMTTTMAPLGRPQPIHVATSSVSAATNYIQGGSLVSAMSSPGILPSFGTMTTSSPGLVYPILTRLPHGVVPFQSQHGEPALSHGSRHRRNRHLSERKAGGEEVSAAAASSAAMAAVSFIKNKCRYCGKVFGSDSALQIHLRSHTGERPFKCNICGSRFTTRGNLKVHFQRHKEQYPDISMNPHPVAEHLDNVVTKSGLPYGMSISAEESAAVRENDKIAYPPLKPSDDGAFGIGGIGGGDKLSSVKVERGMGQGGRDDETAVSFATSTNYMFYNKMNSLSNSEASAHVSRANFEERLRSDFSYGSGGGGFPDPRRRSETSKLEQLVQSLEERGLPGGSAGAPGDDGAGVGAVPNQCGVCHRVLSCPSALKVHMRTHTGERPHKCKVCGRAYTTKANLVLHYAVHRGKPAVRALHSCPICQKQFTNAMVLQQHIRMHMGGQIGGSGNESEGGPPSAPGYATAVASPEAVETTRVVAAAAAPAEDEEETGDRYAGERNRPAEEAASYLSGDNMETAEGGSADGENRDADDDEEEFADARDTSFTEGAAEPGPSFSQGPSPPGSVSSDASTGKKPNTNDHRLKLLALVGLGEGFNPIKTESNAEGSNDGMADQSQENGSFRSFSPYDQSKGKATTCDICGKRFPYQSALDIHYRSHTKVHMTTHMWNSVPVRRGRRLSAELHPCLLDSAVPPPSSSDASDSNAATGEDGVAGSSNADGGGGSIVVKHPPPPPPPPPPHHLGHFPPDVFSAGPHASGHRSGSDPNFWIQYAALLANGLAVPPPPLLPPPPPPQPQPLLPPSLPMSSAMVGAVPAVGGGGGVAGASAGGGGGGGVGIGLGGGSSCGSSSSGSSGSAKVNEISVIQNVAVPGTPPRFGGGVGGEGDEHEEAAAMERMVSEGEAAHRYARFMDADKELA